MDLIAKIIAGIIIALQSIIVYFFKRTLTLYDRKITDLEKDNDNLKLQLESQAKSLALISQKDAMDRQLLEKDIELVKTDVASLKSNFSIEMGGVKDMLGRVLNKLDDNDKNFKELFQKLK